MSEPALKKHYTVAEYLAFEETSMDISIPFGEIYERLNFDETAVNIND